MNWLRGIIEGTIGALYTLPGWLALTIISAISGAVALGVVGKILPPGRLEHARERMLAALYELRLYFDSPPRVIAAQGRVIGWSLAYTAWITLPMLALALPFGLVFLHLEARHGLEPLPTHEPIIVRAVPAEGCDGRDLEIAPAEGVEIVTPPLFDATERVVYQSVALHGERAHTIEWTGCGGEVTKRLDTARDGSVSPTRARGLALLWVMTDEAALPSGSPVDQIWVEHPANEDQRWLGLPMPWWLYWLIAMTIVAVALQKPMKVKL